MIRFVNVIKEYGNDRALNQINLELKRGDMAFLTGHSGAGKTTLLKLISKIETPTRGQLFVDEFAIHDLKRRHIPRLRKDLGIIFQDPQLLPERNVFENVALPLVISGMRHPEIRRRVRAALDKVGLLEKEKRLPSGLSAGEKQRVGIARAVVNKPNVLLADEPTGNLDPNLSIEIMKLFEAFNAVGTTVLIATHDLPLIARLNHRIITLKHGQLVGADADA